MANIKIPRKEFEKEIGKLNDKMKEKILAFGTPLESVTEEEIELEIFPDRPDLLSFQGFTRSFKTFLGKSRGLKKYKVKKPGKNYKVEIEDSVKEVRPYTACAIVKNLKFDDEKIKEIIDIQEKIHTTFGRNRKRIAIGIYPLEHIKLPIKFVAKKPEDIKFKPLEFPKEINGRQILSKHPTGREYGNLLKGQKKYPVFIDANNEVLSMPPIINSDKTGKISSETKDVFIECSGFDFNLLKKTLNIIVTALADMNGEIYQMNLQYHNNKQTKRKEITPNLNPEKKKIDIKNINKLLGLELDKKQIKKLLEKMGYNYNNNEVEIPAWRTDILHEVDIAEDIAIAYGYENFEPEIPEVATIGKEDEKEAVKRKIADILTGLNFLETSTYHLLSKEESKKMKRNEEKIFVEKSKTEYEILRPSMLASSLKTLSENTDKEYPQKIFEIGTCFSKDENEDTKIKEKEKLTISITPGNFTKMKQILDYLFKMLNLDYKIDESEVVEYEFIEGRTASILINEKKIGYFGEAHPSLLKIWGLKMPLSYLEIDLKKIFKKV